MNVESEAGHGGTSLTMKRGSEPVPPSDPRHCVSDRKHHGDYSLRPPRKVIGPRRATYVLVKSLVASKIDIGYISIRSTTTAARPLCGSQGQQMRPRPSPRPSRVGLGPSLSLFF